MRKILFLLLFIFLYIASESCKKDSICACQVEQPDENLPWLKVMIQGMICEDIYQFYFEGTEYIIISSCDAASDIIETVYDCDGNRLCTHGGKFPDPSCSLSSSYWDQYYTERRLIFKQRVDPDNLK
jgi:hypothetical protein